MCVVRHLITICCAALWHFYKDLYRVERSQLVCDVCGSLSSIESSTMLQILRDVLVLAPDPNMLQLQRDYITVTLSRVVVMLFVCSYDI